jgi:adenylate cyclase
MPNPSPGFASRPDYRVDLVPESRRVKVVFGGVTIANSTAALRVEETGHDPVYYVPEKDVRVDLMRRTDHHSRCPYKGEASYWTIEVPDAGNVRRAENAVWGYPAPYDETVGIAGYYAFYPNRVDAMTVE